MWRLINYLFIFPRSELSEKKIHPTHFFIDTIESRYKKYTKFISNLYNGNFHNVCSLPFAANRVKLVIYHFFILNAPSIWSNKYRFVFYETPQSNIEKFSDVFLTKASKEFLILFLQFCVIQFASQILSFCFLSEAFLFFNNNTNLRLLWIDHWLSIFGQRRRCVDMEMSLQENPIHILLYQINW